MVRLLSDRKIWCLAAAGMFALLESGATAAPERSLAGIVIGRPASQIFAKYGNPTRVDVGTYTPTMEQMPGMPTDGGVAGLGALPSPTSFGLPSSPGGLEAPPSPTMPGPSSSMMGPSPGSLSGQFGNLANSLFGGVQPSMPTPGMGSAAPFGGVPQMGQPGMQVPRRAVTKYYYDYATGPSLVFTVGYKGLVEQIDAFAPWPWTPAKTSKGINVGAKYTHIIARYGYPDEQKQNPDGTLLMDYRDKAHCAFTMLEGRVVGVSVALVE